MAAGPTYACDFAVGCWCSTPFRKNSFIAASRQLRYVKPLFVVGLGLDLELMGEREMLFLCRNKKWFPSSFVRLGQHCSPGTMRVNLGLCVMGHGPDPWVEGRAPALLVPGTRLPVWQGAGALVLFQVSFRAAPPLPGRFESPPSGITASSPTAVTVCSSAGACWAPSEAPGQLLREAACTGGSAGGDRMGAWGWKETC